jgi:hypothetical protein
MFSHADAVCGMNAVSAMRRKSSPAQVFRSRLSPGGLKLIRFELASLSQDLVNLDQVKEVSKWS